MPKDQNKPRTSKVDFIDPNRLQPNPFQPRERIIEDDKFQELVDSIAEHGVLEPLVIVDTPAGMHIIAGERRWRAAKKNNLTQVPVHIVKTTPKGMLEMAIVENVQRVNLSSLERAQALKRLMQEFNYTLEQVGKKIGKSRQYVQCSLMMLDLPDPIKDGLNKGLINEGHARAILGAGDLKDIMECYRTVIAEGASVRRAEALARFKRTQNEVKKHQPRKHLMPALLDINTDEFIKKWQENLQKKLVSKTSFALSDSSKNTRIVINLKGDPHSRKQDLEKILKLISKK